LLRTLKSESVTKANLKRETAANDPGSTFEWCSCPYTMHVYTWIIRYLMTSLKCLTLLDDHSRTNKDQKNWFKPRGLLNFTLEVTWNGV
jgi:hypothetical protein